MKILVACEESQRVTEELRKRGHEAYSCDILETSGTHEEWHIMQDVAPLLNGNCKFKDAAGGEHNINGKWDMIIAFPPCTHLAVSGARHFEGKRADGRQKEGIEFFCKFLSADCDRIAIENPVGIMGGGDYLKQYFPEIAEKYGLPKTPTQIIQPYEYGDPAKKTTCLWLKGLKPLEPTEIVEPKLVKYECKNGKTATFSVDYCSGGGDTARRRSKTYSGIARAMAEQWTQGQEKEELTENKGEKEEMKEEMATGSKIVYISSPYRGETQRNKEYARELTKAAINSGFAPVTVHLYLTEVLDDNKPDERSLGMEAGRNIMKQCGFILVGDRYGVSEGMKEEIVTAALKGLTMLYEKDGKLYHAGTGKEAISN